MNGTNHTQLMGKLHSIPFVAVLENDWRRESDGRNLRLIFADESGLEVPRDAEQMEASFLEVVVALAYDMADIAIPRCYPAECFWEMMRNIGLTRITDESYDYQPKFCNSTVERTVRIVMSRSYSPTGQGGLFPLRYPPDDQRNVELWYQMNEYIIQTRDI